MRKLSWFVACYFLFAAPSGFCQTLDKHKDGWGPWRYTDFKVSGILFRSKCLSDSGADSKWAYQFRSWHDRPTDFVEREEHGVEGGSKNEWNAPAAFTLEKGAMSPVFETQLHGTCAEVHQLKIEIVCNVAPYVYPNAPCFHDADGSQVEFKPIPAHPRYE